jgi:ATP-dependent RNA helicase RhlB
MVSKWLPARQDLILLPVCILFVNQQGIKFIPGKKEVFLLLRSIVQKMISCFKPKLEEISIQPEFTGPAAQAELPPERPRRNRKRKNSTPANPAVAELPGATGAEERSWDPARFCVEPSEGRTRFHDFDLPEGIMRAVHDLGFQYCTPIQAEILPPVLAGQDAFGKAQTGTGKSAAFLIAILARLLRDGASEERKPCFPRALILAPTRELTIQINKDAEDLDRYSGMRTLAVFGGIDYEKQKQILQHEVVDVLIATPGRLLDFCRQQIVRLDRVEILVIDEADRLLDMGFIPDVSRIIQQTPAKDKRQTMLFSATLTPQISRLASQWTKNPVTVEIEPERVAAESIDQIVYMTTTEEKFTVLYNLITGKKLERVIVFCNRRDATRRIRDKLVQYGISCAMLSGEVSQDKRMKTLDNFKAGKIKVLVATDVAGRGLHIEGISHVVNYNLPQDAEDYVHRIGRTGRAGATGTSVSFADESESFYLPQIEEYMGQKLPCTYPDSELLDKLPPPKFKKIEESRRPAPGRRDGRNTSPGRSSGRPVRRSPGNRPARPKTARS